MAFATAVIVGSALAGAAGATAISGGFGGDKKSESGLPAPPTLPDPTTAKDTAQAAQTRQRQILLATGGQTDYTEGSGAILGSDTTKQTLLGG